MLKSKSCIISNSCTYVSLEREREGGMEKRKRRERKGGMEKMKRREREGGGGEGIEEG